MLEKTIADIEPLTKERSYRIAPLMTVIATTECVQK